MLSGLFIANGEVSSSVLSGPRHFLSSIELMFGYRNCKSVDWPTLLVIAL